ncbi:hypothetical protein COOONC_09062 [Cooperia oncophora]
MDSSVARRPVGEIRNRHKNGPVRIEQEPRVSRAEAEENSMEFEQASSVKADIWKDVVSLDQSSREKPISLKNLFPDNKVVDRTLKRKIANRKKKESAKRRRVNREERLRELNEEKEEKEKVPHRESANRLIIGRIVRGDFSFYAACGRALSYVPLCTLEDALLHVRLNDTVVVDDGLHRARRRRLHANQRVTFVTESWSVAYASDPSEWERKFGECWNVAEKILEKKASHPEHDITYNELALVRIYELIVSESHTQNHCLLVHKPILNPLLRLFDWCERAEGLRPNKLGHPSATEKHFVVLLNQNDVGQLARDALLLILSVSANHEQIAEFVAYKSAFCPVVATGLSGCFSQLSRIIAGDGVERFLPEHTAESLANFHSSLLFCNAVVQAAHPAVVEQICSFFYSGFLISVVKPALLQDEQESVAAATVYLQLCIETVTEPSLLRTVIRMLLLERDDERRLLIEVIVGRIANGDKPGGEVPTGAVVSGVSIEILSFMRVREHAEQ